MRPFARIDDSPEARRVRAIARTLADMIRSFAFPSCALVVGTVVVAAPAHAASWGSFDGTRIAYATGTLDGDAHDGLRAAIAAHGDVLAAATGTLTAEYLDGVDVFYTAMLSDGTGPTAGDPGSLSGAELAALQAWLDGGGTLVLTIDANGLDGPWDTVYDTWAAPFGVGELAWSFGPADGMPTAEHPITFGVGQYAFDSPTTFSVPAEADVIGTGLGTDPFLAVFEPASGYVDGGRILVIGDHNALTDGYLGDADNAVLAANLVVWAAGQCGNGSVERTEACDDGNVAAGDGCDPLCQDEGGGDSTGTGGDGSGSSEAGGSSSGDAGGSSNTAGAGESTGASATDASASAGASASASASASAGSSEGGGAASETAADDSTGAAAQQDDGGGCSCRSTGGGQAPAWLLVVASIVLGRRRRSRMR